MHWHGDHFLPSYGDMMLAQPLRFHRVLCTDERGASSVEYALLMMLIAVVIIAGITAFGTATGDLFRSTCDAMPGGTC